MGSAIPSQSAGAKGALHSQNSVWEGEAALYTTPSRPKQAPKVSQKKGGQVGILTISSAGFKDCKEYKKNGNHNSLGMCVWRGGGNQD